jgi:hypothetical protein
MHKTAAGIQAYFAALGNYLNFSPEFVLLRNQKIYVSIQGLIHYV